MKAGPGGRSSVAGYTATVFGSTGFVARYLVNRLGSSCLTVSLSDYNHPIIVWISFLCVCAGKQGVQVVVPYRGDDLEPRHLRVMGDVGQIVPHFFALKDYDSVVKSVKDSQVVFNLIGRDYETGFELSFLFFLFFLHQCNG